MIAHIPGGLISEKFGGKWTCSLGVLFMAILNAATPKAVEYGELTFEIDKGWNKMAERTNS